MASCALLLSIRPKYAERILQGMKTVELRRMRPRVSRGDLLLLYVSWPVRAVKAMSVIDRVTSERPNKLWKQIRCKASITRNEFTSYFKGAKVAFAIHFRYVQRFASPVPLPRLREFWPGFRPPQSYHYLTPEMFFEFLRGIGSNLQNTIDKGVVPVTGRKNSLVGAHLGITPQEVTNILTEVKNKRAESKEVRKEIDEITCKL